MGTTEPEVFIFKSPLKGGEARGFLSKAGYRSFTVVKGSWASAEITRTMKAHHQEERRRLIERGVLGKSSSGIFGFLVNHEFTSPGEAASIVQGGSRNGLDCWLDAAGKSLKQRGLP